MWIIFEIGRFKGVRLKFWNFLYYWPDLTEIFTQYVNRKKNTFCS